MRPDHDHFSVTYRGCRFDLICMTPGFQVIVFDHVRGNISPGRLITFLASEIFLLELNIGGSTTWFPKPVGENPELGCDLQWVNYAASALRV
jgi:hypothetical protein